MGRRKGELDRRQIDRDWPHQIALPSGRCGFHDYVSLRLFCENLSLCPRGYSFYRDATDYTVYCFAEQEHADRFQARFGGELIDPADRPRWGKPRGKQKAPPERS